MRRALFGFLVTVIVILVVGDLALRSFAEERMADALEAGLEIPAETEVSVDAFPFLLSSLRGRYPRVTIDAEDVSEGSVRLSRLQLEFTDVEFSLSNLLSGEERQVRLGAGDGEGLLRERDLNRALRQEGVPARTDLLPEGHVEFFPSGGSKAVLAHVAAEGSDLVITPRGLGLAPFSLPLPTFGSEMTYDSIDVRGSTARLGVSVGETVVEF
jgi:hypothetical protein